MVETTTLPATDVKPLKTHIMHDIETFGTRPGAVVLSVGAVKFNAEGMIDRFHVGIDPEDAQRYGLHIEAGAVMWWLHPDRAAAREALLKLPKIDLFSALDGFREWVLQTPADNLGSLWGNGATFDNTLLDAAYHAVKLDYPVSYRKDECYRTLCNRFPDVKFTKPQLAHDALEDAVAQAFHLVEINRAHGINL